MVPKPKRTKCRPVILSRWHLFPPGWRFSAVNEGIGLWLLAGCILSARQQDLSLADPPPRLVEQGDRDSTENRSDQASHLRMDFIKAKKRW